MADLLNVVWKQQPICDGWCVAPDTVVWISVEALDAEWQTSEDYIGVGGAGSPHVGRYKRFGEFFAIADFITMPTVCLDDSALSFTNGRHRFAWLRDHRLRTMPIEVPPYQAAIFTTRFGSCDHFGIVST